MREINFIGRKRVAEVEKDAIRLFCWTVGRLEVNAHYTWNWKGRRTEKYTEEPGCQFNTHFPISGPFFGCIFQPLINPIELTFWGLGVGQKCPKLAGKQLGF